MGLKHFMAYYPLQQRIYENKLSRNFNVSDVGKEIILMTEEFGELCDAYLINNDTEIVDAIGDIMVYCLGLSAMFRWNADEVLNPKVESPNNPTSLENFFPYVGREIGMVAKTYKKSNKQPVDKIDNQDQFRTHLGNLMGYCSLMFDYVKAEEISVLEEIIRNNEQRTHQGKI